MREEDRNEAVGGETPARKAGDARKTRGIRFSGSEWEEVKRAARAHGSPAAEFVRERILVLARAGGRRDPPGGAVLGAADRADVPLHLVPGDGKTRRDGARGAR